MAADLTQDELAERAGVDRTSVQNAEGAKVDCKFSLIMRIAAALRLPARDLMP